MTNEEYAKRVKKASPPSPLGMNALRAFLVGGSICALGQGLNQLYQGFGMDQEGAGTAASVTLIFLAALLTGLGIFDNIAKFAGAGTLVPITGFANAMVSPALEFKTEGIILPLPDHILPFIVFHTADDPFQCRKVLIVDKIQHRLTVHNAANTAFAVRAEVLQIIVHTVTTI